MRYEWRVIDLDEHVARLAGGPQLDVRLVLDSDDPRLLALVERAAEEADLTLDRMPDDDGVAHGWVEL